MYMLNNHCHRVTALLKLNILLYIKNIFNTCTLDDVKIYSIELVCPLSAQIPL